MFEGPCRMRYREIALGGRDSSSGLRDQGLIAAPAFLTPILAVRVTRPSLDKSRRADDRWSQRNLSPHRRGTETRIRCARDAEPQSALVNLKLALPLVDERVPNHQKVPDATGSRELGCRRVLSGRH